MKKLETLREQIATLQGEIQRLRLNYATRDEAAARIESWVDMLAGTINARSVAHSAIVGSGINSEPFRTHARVMGGSHAVEDLSPFLAWLDPQAMKDRLLAELDELSDECSTQNPDERKATLTKKQAELEELEIAEESEIVRLEKQGTFIPRRPDCRPEIVLSTEAV